MTWETSITLKSGLEKHPIIPSHDFSLVTITANRVGLGKFTLCYLGKKHPHMTVTASGVVSIVFCKGHVPPFVQILDSNGDDVHMTIKYSTV